MKNELESNISIEEQKEGACVVLYVKYLGEN